MRSPTLFFSFALGTSLVSFASAQASQATDTGINAGNCVNNTVVQDSNGVNNYTLYCGVDSQPGAFDEIPASSLDQCLLQCDAANTCVGVTWDGNNCFLKAQYAYQFKSAPSDIVAVQVVPPYQPTSNYVTETNDACANNDPNQNGTSFVVQDTNNFQWNTSCGSDTGANNAYFGYYSDPTTGDMSGSNGTAYPATTSFNQCFEQCDSITDPSGNPCTAFTFVGSQTGGGTCYFKTGYMELTQPGGYNSGKVAAVRLGAGNGPASGSSSSTSSSSSAASSTTSSTTTSAQTSTPTTTSSTTTSSSSTSGLAGLRAIFLVESGKFFNNEPDNDNDHDHDN